MKQGRTIKEVSLFKPKKKSVKKTGHAPFKLGVRSLAKKGFGLFFGNFGVMIVTLFVPIVASVLFQMTQTSLLSNTPYVGRIGQEILYVFLVSAVFPALFRFVLNDEKANFPGIKFGAQEFETVRNVLGIYIFVAFALALPGALLYASFWAMENYPELIWWRALMAVFGPVFVIASILVLDAVVRLHLALPSVVLGQPTQVKERLKTALEMGSGYVVTLITALTLAALPFLILLVGVRYIPLLSVPFDVPGVLSLILYWAYFAVFSNMYAIAFREIEKERLEKSDPEKAEP